MAGIKRAAREVDRPIVKKAKVHNGTKTSSAGHRAVTVKNVKARSSGSTSDSDALSESDGSDLDGENDVDEEMEEPYVESKRSATLRKTGENGDEADAAVNGKNYPLNMQCKT